MIAAVCLTAAVFIIIIIKLPRQRIIPPHFQPAKIIRRIVQFLFDMAIGGGSNVILMAGG